MSTAEHLFVNYVLPAMGAPTPPEAEKLAEHLANHGSVTYDPKSGDVHSSGYILPTHPEHSSVSEGTPEAIHDYITDKREALSEPGTVLHAHQGPDGAYLHVATHTHDPGEALGMALGLGGYQDLSTGEVAPTQPSEAA